jgi:hypothetical protein
VPSPINFATQSKWTNVDRDDPIIYKRLRLFMLVALLCDAKYNEPSGKNKSNSTVMCQAMWKVGEVGVGWVKVSCAA